MVGFLNPESNGQVVDKLSNLGKIAGMPSPYDFDPTLSDIKILKPGEIFNNRLPQTGTWDGEKGNSTWCPKGDDIPSLANSDERTWDEILNDRGIEGIPFNDGEPDFSEISKGTVEIDDFSTDRFGAGGNFDQADEKLAEQRGCTKEEVQQWRRENDYTWHEKQDCKTMQKVPRDVHNNVPHIGGISILKSKQQTETQA